jgi:uncharacterized protein YeaO (DUF488 family)
MAKQQRITEKMVREWVEKNWPDMGISKEGQAIGIWKKDVGPAHGFTTIGQTWRDAALHLGMITYEE